ncbi:hypothetical protein E1A91_D07G156600v1 [Gossypium mustelinum]|uniref:pyridoxal 5'-phosphate synthase n=1 Tax=Gossypium mustelinum TaxID=34275 RepID=A0A5D2U8K3_GOSMU|nr:hypothetical protein E1A91_D07G156600v1 [Gossypium mustelinum]
MGTITAPWKQLLLNALESNSHLKHSSYFQLATVGCNGRPSNRTLVFRGFQESSDKFHINTDNRTHKIEELKQCPFAEFRISGRVDVIDGSNPDTFELQQREKSWFASSFKSRLQYLGPNPGLPRISEHQSEEEVRLDPSIGPVAAFCLLVLDPDQVDYLNLKSTERVKFISTLDMNGVKNWTSERINP